MIRGLYTSALGMTTQMKKMDVVANNIANVNTTGFKKDLVVTKTFTEELMKRLDDKSDLTHTKKIGELSFGLFVDDIYSDFSNGSLARSDGKLDCGISGSGFFAVSVKDKDGGVSEKYTRDGAFTLNSTGTLMTKEGNKVVGAKGDIIIPNGNVHIDEKGNIYSNDVFVDSLKMVDFEDLHTLRKYGDNLYNKTEESKTKNFAGTIEQGFLENSNANSVREMVDMITVSRTYEANQRMVGIHDTILSRTVNDIGRK